MYNELEIKNIKNYWTVWLAEFVVNEERDFDIKDQSKIATSISNNFHKTGKARFKIKKGKIIRIG